MKACGGCTAEYQEDFNFCPKCGKEFGADASDLKRKMDQHLKDMARAAGQEARLTFRHEQGEWS